MATLVKQLTSLVFEHTQSVASVTWIIAHNMGMYPVVDVFVDYQGESQKILPKSVQYNNANQITITFSTPLAGKVSLS